MLGRILVWCVRKGLLSFSSFAALPFRVCPKARMSSFVLPQSPTYTHLQPRLSSLACAGVPASPAWVSLHLASPPLVGASNIVIASSYQQQPKHGGQRRRDDDQEDHDGLRLA